MAGGELKALRDRLRAASGPDRELDTAVGEALNVPGNGRPGIDVGSVFWVAPPLTASVDLALALCERKLPEWQGVYMTTEWTGYTRPGNGVRCSVTLRRGIHSYIEAVSGDCPTLPLAILIALLGALIEEEIGDA